MKKTLFTTAASLLLGFLLSLPPKIAAAADINPSDLVGIWRLDAKTLLASGTMYSTLSDGGACTQVLKIKAVGMTHWSVAKCSWSSQQSALSMKIVSSPTQPEKVGESNTMTVDSVTRDSLVITNKKKETQTWTRVPELPAEFSAEFTKRYAPTQATQP